MAEGVTSILVVDDDPDVCWALKRVLCEEGHTVETVESGREALTRLQDTRFQLILIDAKLSDIDGMDLARRMRAERACVAPLILVSGYFYSDDNLVQECLRSGLFCAFVTKPFRHEDLRHVIRKTLGTEQTPHLRRFHNNGA